MNSTERESLGSEDCSMSGIRYVHTNIVAKDWRRIVAFYVHVFGCKIVPPERDLSGAWLEELTGIPDARIQGAHLALPGYEKNGPTLEVFGYSPGVMRSKPDEINRQGFAHIAFHVEDVETVVSRVREAGGGILGSIVRKEYDGIGVLTVAYCHDPEGNHIEVQNWSS